MSNASDIAAHAQRFNDGCPRTHTAVTEPSRKVDAPKDGIVKLPQKKAHHCRSFVSYSTRLASLMEPTRSCGSSLR
jgi:hypothetical protein